MNCIDSCCPLCIRRVCLSFCKMLGLRKKKSEKGGQDVEEDEARRITSIELANNSHDQHKLVNKVQPIPPPPAPPQPIKTPKTEIKVTEEELFDDIGKDVLLPTQSKPAVDRREPVIVEDLLNDTPQAVEEQPVVVPLRKEPELPAVSFIETGSFRINLEPYEKYYALLEEKSRNLRDKLNIPGTAIPVEKVGNTELQIRHSQPDKLNIFVYSFRLPCTYSYYCGMLNDYTLQKRMDTNIDDYRLLELITNNARVNYLSYKKVLIVSPRDFVYMKYSNSWENQYWDLSFSVPHEVFPSKVRGDIILSACKITEDPEGIRIQVYSEVDMKLTVSPKITKNQAIAEIRKYVQRCEQYVRTTYNKQFV